MKTNEWCYLDDIRGIEDDVYSFHCDTRDFYCVKMSNPVSGIQPTEAEKLVKNRFAINICLLAHKDEILPWLKSIEQMSGGKAEWRCLNFKGINTDCGWLKYIRFYRLDDNMFVVSDSEGKPFDTLLATEENLERDLLNTH